VADTVMPYRDEIARLRSLVRRLADDIEEWVDSADYPGADGVDESRALLAEAREAVPTEVPS
jgi:hypothetical protein